MGEEGGGSGVGVGGTEQVAVAGAGAGVEAGLEAEAPGLECWTLVFTPQYAPEQIAATPMQAADGSFLSQTAEYLLRVPAPHLLQAFLGHCGRAGAGDSGGGGSGGGSVYPLTALPCPLTALTCPCPSCPALTSTQSPTLGSARVRLQAMTLC
mmetsp:Transcript_17888/g.40124  ORF Transcript_17888/g.40124 Transcript_17888/m.40124 type:complete len:153 (-) Transcript_17888:449-907(-)